VTETGERRRPQHWVKSWWKEESIWRDVTTRTLAILMSSAVIYVLAMAGGYVSRPDILPFAIMLFIVIGVPVCTIGLRRDLRHCRTAGARAAFYGMMAMLWVVGIPTVVLAAMRL